MIITLIRTQTLHSSRFKEAEKFFKNPKFGSQKISSSVIKKLLLLRDLTYFNKVQFTRNFRSCSKIELKGKMADLLPW